MSGSFSPQVTERLSKIAETVALFHLTAEPDSTLQQNEINGRLFTACCRLCEAITDEDIDEIHIELLRIAEDEGFHRDSISHMMILAQHAYLNGLKHVQESAKQPPSSKIMDEILQDMRQHSGANDMQVAISSKLAEIFKTPARIDIDNLFRRFKGFAQNTDFEGMILPCLLHGLHMATQEYRSITNEAKSVIPGTATFFVNRPLNE